MAILPNNTDEKAFNKMLTDMGNNQVLPNGKRMSVKTISSYLNNMDIRKVRMLVDNALDFGKIKYEYPAKVTKKNRDISILLKIITPVRKNVLPYKQRVTYT
jgi:hypothetical protein